MKRHLLVVSFRHFLLWAILLSLSLSACLDENVSCVTDAYDSLRVNFLKLDPNNARRDSLYFVSVQAANGVFLDIQDTVLSSIALPLNPSDDEVVFYVNWRENSSAALQQDTLVLRYDREQKLVSPECGVEQRFVNLRSSREAFDSLRIVEEEVSLFTSPNISIYTCQYEFTDLVSGRFFTTDTVSTDPLQTRRVGTELLVNRITDNRGNSILSEPDSLTRVALPVNINTNSTTFFFEIVDQDQGIINRELEVSYFVDTIRIFNCDPQVRVSNLDVDTDGYDFVNVEVVQEVLNINNRNLEILF